MKKKEKRSYDPIFTMSILVLIVMILSMIFNIIGVEGNKSEIVGNSLESSLVVVKNIFSVDGIQYLLNQIGQNIVIFKPLLLLIVTLMGISIGTTSGFLEAVFHPLKKYNLIIITFLVLLLSVFSSIIGESAFIILIPLTAVMYQYIGRNPMTGALTAFLGVSIGFGANFIFGAGDYALGTLTELAAKIDVDETYQFNLMSTSFIMMASSIIIPIIGTVIINKFLANKLTVKYKTEDININKRGLLISLITFLVLVGFVVYCCIPGLKLPLTGSLLDFNSDIYVNKLLGANSPFRNGIVVIVSFIIMICSFVYGRISGSVEDNHEYGLGINTSFRDLGYVFVLLFFLSILSSVIEYTNIGVVIATKLIDFMSTMPLTGIPLIVISFFVILLISVFIPDLVTKWQLCSPVMIPLFMRANITPDFTQFIFKIADGVGKSLTPMCIYLLILVGFLKKYNTKEEQITLFGTLKLMFPSIVLFVILWLLIIIGWYVVGLPLGEGTFPTL